MERLQKEKELERLTDNFKNSKACVFADYRGLKVGEITQLRNKLYGAASTMKVIKNRIAKLALKKTGIQGLEGFFSGPTTMAWSTKDEVAPAKILVEFAKNNEKLVIKGGYLGGKVIDLNFVKALAALPSREALLAKMVGSIAAPATNLVGVLNAVPRKLVTALDAIKNKKQ